MDTAEVREWIKPIDSNLRQSMRFIKETEIDTTALDGALFEGDSDKLRELNLRLSKRQGPIIIAYGLTSTAIHEGIHYPEIALVHEQSISTNTAAAGGNASLMTIV